jgi:hypothetical protein
MYAWQSRCMDLEGLIPDIADALKIIDGSRVPFKTFQPGVGPYGEPQLVKIVAEHLNRIPHYGGVLRRCALLIF